MHSVQFFLVPAVLLVRASFAATAAEVRHPVFPTVVDRGQVARLEAQAKRVMDFSPDQIGRWIVAKSSFEMVACPNCEWPGGRRDRKDYWQWSADDPDHIRCTHCGMEHPNPRYPLSAIDRIADPTGRVQEFPYYPAKDGYKYYLAGKLDNARKQYMERMVPILADLYAATRQSRYARQAALILDRLAETYPHYNVQVCRREGSPLLLQTPILEAPDGLVKVPPPGLGTAGRDEGAHYPYWSNRRGDGWNGWYYSEMPIELVYAYDLVADCDDLDRLSAELGHDVRSRICNFFRDTANYVRSYPLYLGNMDPTLIRGLAVIGRVIGEPEFVHDALRRLKMILERRFFPDGNWREGAASYHSQTISGLRSAAAGPLKGYCDPPGYMGREDGLHLKNLDLSAALPLLGESFDALAALELPNGSQACIHDTWSPTTHGRRLARPKPDPMPSCLHWGMGHAILGTGRQDTGLQAHLHFSGGYGHQHADTLNLILFGQGRELVSDIGYTHTVVSAYSRNSLAHNLVVVDGQDQRTSGTEPPADGALVASARLGPDVQYVEARGEGAYPGLARLYRRALVLVAAPDGGAYAVDIFRVAGGTRHDWVLHGSADEDMELLTSLATETFRPNLLPEGTEFRPWKDEYGRNILGGVNNSYGLFRDVRCAGGDQTWSASMEGTEGIGVQTTVLDQPGTEVFLGRIPSVRRAQEDSSRVYDYWMPCLLARREGKDLASTFAAVHQAYAPGTQRYQVSRLALENPPAGAVGLVVRGRGFTDYHLSGAEPDSAVCAAAPPIRALGRYAFIRTRDGQPVSMGICDGSRLEYQEIRLDAEPGASGEVVGVRNCEAGDTENALVVAAELPARPGKTGECVVVRFPDGMTYGLAVQEIRREGDVSMIALRHRPGFRLSGDGAQTEQTHWPGRLYPGRPTFHLPATSYHAVE